MHHVAILSCVCCTALLLVSHLLAPRQKTASESREGNRDCILFFYDEHDLWHVLSAFALFFSMLVSAGVAGFANMWSNVHWVQSWSVVRIAVVPPTLILALDYRYMYRYTGPSLLITYGWQINEDFNFGI